MWKNVTQYSRGDKERKATTYRITSGSISIVITCDHIHYKPQWIMHCRVLGIDTKPLGLSGEDKLEEAKGKAIRIVNAAIGELVEDAKGLWAKG